MAMNPETARQKAIDAANKTQNALNALNALGGAVNKVDSGFVRNPSQEAEAIKNLGLTKAEINARGGINASGYFGDSWNPKTNLTDAEYAAAVAKGGGAAVNAATEAKIAKSNPPASGGGEGSNLPGVTTASLARDTFINTLALIMGKDEASKPYVAELYKLVSGFYKSGSSIQDSINLALYQAKTNNAIPEFTNRFSGIFKLQERRAAGEAIDVPTIAEYIKSQERLGTVLRQSGLGDLANETFLNTVMATGKSVDESTSIVTDVFDLIDNAPKEWKAEVARTMPSATRADLAKALLTGPEGVKGLERTVRKAGIVAAGTMQGLNISDTIASDLLSKNQSFATAGAQFARVAQILPEAQKLMSIESGLAPEKAYSIEQAVSATFDQNAAELQKLADLAERERARMSGRAGTIGSKSFSSQARGQGLI
jgi:hypothetical protein